MTASCNDVVAALIGPPPSLASVVAAAHSRRGSVAAGHSDSALQAPLVQVWVAALGSRRPIDSAPPPHPSNPVAALPPPPVARAPGHACGPATAHRSSLASRSPVLVVLEHTPE